jgi:transcription elongation factor Elf1
MKFRTNRKTLVAKLDALFSTYIRIRDKRRFAGKCPFCKVRPIQGCFHWVTRSKQSVRWDESNAVASCNPCTLKFEYHPPEFIQWFLANIGQEAYDALILKSNAIIKRGVVELRLLVTELEMKIERVCLSARLGP